MTTRSLDAIVRRHHPDREELGRVCRACAQPWPCDVQLVAELVRPAVAPSAVPGVRAHRAPRAASRRAPVPVGIPA